MSRRILNDFENFVVMPEELTAENGAKALLIGEFHENVIIPCETCAGTGFMDDDCFDEVCECCDGAGDYALKVTIGWGTIRDIYAKCVEHFQNKLDNKGE